MHSDIEMNVTTTSTGWVKFEEPPGAWRTTEINTCPGNENLKRGFCDVSNRWGMGTTNSASLTLLVTPDLTSLWRSFTLKKQNRNPTPQYFQNDLTWPYPMFTRWDSCFQSFQQNAALKKHQIKGKKEIYIPHPPPSPFIEPLLPPPPPPP